MSALQEYHKNKIENLFAQSKGNFVTVFHVPELFLDSAPI